MSWPARQIIIENILSVLFIRPIIAADGDFGPGCFNAKSFNWFDYIGNGSSEPHGYENHDFSTGAKNFGFRLI